MINIFRLAIDALRKLNLTNEDISSKLEMPIEDFYSYYQGESELPNDVLLRMIEIFGDDIPITTKKIEIYDEIPDPFADGEEEEEE